MVQLINKLPFSWALFNEMPVIGILRNVSFRSLEQLLPVCVQAGLTNLEITMNSENALEQIRYAAEKYPGMINIGAGTVCTLSELSEALESGAQFIVTPIVDEAVITSCVAGHIPVFPGAHTATEIYRAHSLGAPVVKLFPAASLGADYMKNIRGPFPQIKLLPTGGMGLEHIQSFLDAGAVGFGIGSPLFRADLIAAGDWNGLNAHMHNFIRQIKLILHAE